MNWLVLLQVVTLLQKDIQKAAADKQITLGEAIDIVKDVLDKTGLSNTVIVTPKMIEDLKKKMGV